MILSRVINYIRTASFLLDNIVQTRRLNKIPNKKIENKLFQSYEFDHYRKGDLKAIRSIHKKCLNKDLTGSKRLLIRILGHKLCCIIRDNSHKVIACILFYFSKKDISEGTIHLNSIIVREEKHGCGLGTVLIKYAIENLRSVEDLMGVSSRVSLNNKVSLRLHLNSDFAIKEEYYDTDMQEMRAYLVLQLKN